MYQRKILLFFMPKLIAMVMATAIYAGPQPLAEWSVLTYIEADNNLEPFATYNISDMQKVGSTSKVNILVQWDQPNNLKTWRYKIKKGSKIEDSSVAQEMGIDPVKEIVEAMKWVIAKYPAKRYMLNLWNHGNGWIDRAKRRLDPLSWLSFPGMNRAKMHKDRGILYDDTNGTYLATKDLATVFSQIKQLLGRNIDIVGTDACLMAMIEVAYQIKDYADYLVGSEHTEPGYGWSYKGFLAPLVATPTMTPENLCKQVVSSYKNFYQANKEKEYTLSALRLNQAGSVSTTLTDVLTALKACDVAEHANTVLVINQARSSSITFYYPDYRDLASWYSQLLTGAQKFLKSQNSKANLIIALNKAVAALQAMIAANATAPLFTGAGGLSIYYPLQGISPDYAQLAFTINSTWLSFLQSGLA